MSFLPNLRELMLDQLSRETAFPALPKSKGRKPAKSARAEDCSTLLVMGEVMELVLDFRPRSLNSTSTVPWPAPKQNTSLEEALTKSISVLADKVSFITIRIAYSDSADETADFIALQSRIIECLAKSIINFEDLQHIRIMLNYPKYDESQVANARFFVTVCEDFELTLTEGNNPTVTSNADDDSAVARLIQSLTENNLIHVRFTIPDKAVRAVIGFEGKRMRALEHHTGCTIRVGTEQQSINGFRHVFLRGTRVAVTAVRIAIIEAIPVPVKEETIVVPAGAMNMILGKNGGNLKAISSNSNCRIVVPKLPSVWALLTITLSGTDQAVARAKELINPIVSRYLNQRNSSDPCSHTHYPQSYLSSNEETKGSENLHFASHAPAFNQNTMRALDQIIAPLTPELTPDAKE